MNAYCITLAMACLALHGDAFRKRTPSAGETHKSQPSDGGTIESQLFERSASNQTNDDALESNSTLERSLAAKGRPPAPPPPPPVYYTPRTGHFVHLGFGKCQAGGKGPAFGYLHGQGPNCENSCYHDSQCAGYSVSKYNNCIHWKECGLSAGGDNWGDAHCNVKPSANECPVAVAHASAEQPSHLVDPHHLDAQELIDELENDANKLIKSDAVSPTTCMSLSVGSFVCTLVEAEHSCQCRYMAPQQCSYWFGDRNINLMIARSTSPDGILLLPQEKCSCSEGDGKMEYYCSFGFLDTVPKIGLADP